MASPDVRDIDGKTFTVPDADTFNLGNFRS
jgi:hypothetical protein